MNSKIGFNIQLENQIKQLVSSIDFDNISSLQNQSHKPQGSGLQSQFLDYNILDTNSINLNQTRYPDKLIDPNKMLLRKTSLCKYWLKGICTKPCCDFAHGDRELHSTPNIWKTTICKHWRAGSCPNGDNCRHAHGEMDLRYDRSIPNSNSTIDSPLKKSKDTNHLKLGSPNSTRCSDSLDSINASYQSSYHQHLNLHRSNTPIQYVNNEHDKAKQDLNLTLQIVITHLMMHAKINGCTECLLLNQKLNDLVVNNKSALNLNDPKPIFNSNQNESNINEDLCSLDYRNYLLFGQDKHQHSSKNNLDSLTHCQPNVSSFNKLNNYFLNIGYPENPSNFNQIPDLVNENLSFDKEIYNSDKLTNLVNDKKIDNQEFTIPLPYSHCSNDSTSTRYETHSHIFSNSGSSYDDLMSDSDSVKRFI